MVHYRHPVGCVEYADHQESTALLLSRSSSIGLGQNSTLFSTPGQVEESIRGLEYTRGVSLSWEESIRGLWDEGCHPCQDVLTRCTGLTDTGTIIGCIITVASAASPAESVPRIICI
jgi:hypothetical protein